MPIKIPDGLPAKDILISEEVAIIDESTAIKQDIRPLRILLLNLMPDKITTETQIARVLGATPLQIELTLLRTGTYLGKNTPESHLIGFYQTFDDIKHQRFDGMIVTGAPVAQIPFEEIEYWNELIKIFDWAEHHVYGSLFICWGAQAALHHFYNHTRSYTDQKQFGVFPHKRLNYNHALTKGFDDVIWIPVSRITCMNEKDIQENASLNILLNSDETGIALITNDTRNHVYMLNHLEYDALTLDQEYKRDRAKGLDIQIPAHYYPDNNPALPPSMNWRAHRNLFFANWINIIYQGTPYDLNEL